MIMYLKTLPILRNKCSIIVCGFALYISSMFALQAETLAVYNFDSPNPAKPTLADDSDQRYEMSDISWVVPADDSAPYGFGGQFSSAYINNAFASRTYDSNIYLTFTIQAANGHVLNLDSLSFRFGATVGKEFEGSNVPVFCRIFSDAQRPPFSAELMLKPWGTGEAGVLLSQIPTQTPVYRDGKAILEGADFQNKDRVTFRLAIYCPENSSRIFLRFESISLQGGIEQK